MESNENNEIRYKIYPFLMFCLAIVFIVIIFPNVYLSLKYLFSPKKIPVINGLLYEEGTKKPLNGIQIEAAWLESVGTAGGGSLPSYKKFRTVTNEKGEFILPSVPKPYPYGMPPLFIRDYGGFRVKIYSVDYTAEDALFEAADIVRIKIGARPYKDANELIEKLIYPWSDLNIHILEDFDKKYTLADVKNESALYDLKELYAKSQMFYKARIVYLELKKRFPLRYPENVDEEISFLRRKYPTHTDKGGRAR